MNNQEAFTTSARHLLKQDRKSLDHRQGCAYRAGKLKCAIGCLIPDDQYFKNLEGKSVAHIYYQIPALEGLDSDLLIALQKVHDDSRSDNWSSKLQSIAKQHKLKWEI